MRKRVSFLIIRCCLLWKYILYSLEEKALLNRKRVRGQHRRNERGAVDASAERMHAASTGAAVVILTCERRNGLRD